VATTTVKIVPEGADDSLGEVVLSRTIDGQETSVVLVSEHTFDSVYEGVPEDAERLEPGKYVRLLNAEMITGFFNPFFVVICTPLVVWFFACHDQEGQAGDHGPQDLPGHGHHRRLVAGRGGRQLPGR
jgi:hypothetical protein